MPQSDRMLWSNANVLSLAATTGVDTVYHSTSERRMLTRHCSACKANTDVMQTISTDDKPKDLPLLVKTGPLFMYTLCQGSPFAK